MNSPSDHILMMQVREGDVGGLGILFERHHAMLFNFFLRMTGSRQLSEDLVQDVFYRILKYRHTYREKSRFTTWMYKIARHVRYDELRRRRLEVFLDDDHGKRPDREPNPIEVFEKGQELRLLRAALLKLPPEKREVLVLSRFQRMKYEEIASILDCDTGAVKVRVYRAIRELRAAFFELAGERAS